MSYRVIAFQPRIVNCPFEPNEVPPGTIYKFELDDTVLLPTTLLPSSFFFNHLIKACSDLELKVNQLRDKLLVLIIKNATYHTEKELPQFIQSLRDRKIPVSFLTNRPKKLFNTDIAALTLEHLTSVGIPAVECEEFNQEEEPYQSEGGIFFANRTNKGVFLKTLYQKDTPNFLVFGDAFPVNVQQVAEQVDGWIPHYSFQLCRPRNATFKEDSTALFAAIEQLKYLVYEGKVIEDQEALQLAQKIGDLKPETYLRTTIKEIDENVSLGSINLLV